MSADTRLLALQLSAGGEADGVLAVPQLASLVRLVRSLGVIVSRGVVAADGDVDLDLWVLAQPDGNHIRLAIAGWTERPRLVFSDQRRSARARDLAVVGSDGNWEADAALRLTAVDAQLRRALPKDWQGQRLMRVLALDGDESGDLPLHDAVFDGLAFSGQHARVVGRSDVEIWMNRSTRSRWGPGRCSGRPPA